MKRIFTIFTIFTIFLVMSANFAFADQNDVRNKLILMVEKANANPEVMDDLECIYQFDIDKGKYQIEVLENTATFADGTPWKPDSTIITTEETFMKIISGELDPTEAYLTGKVKIRGSLSKAMELKRFFDLLRDE